jgi:alkylation response protein AidB-like acyl-CoA dehydrogenase
VTPTISLDGRHWINEVTLQNVAVPEENLVGEQGQGWIYARFLLSKERAVVAGLPMLRRMLLELQIRVAERPRGQGTAEVLGDRLQRTALRLQIELAALEFLEYRLMEIGDHSEADLLAPVLKLRACEWRQKISEAMFELIGESGLLYSSSRDETLEYHQPSAQVNSIVANYLFQRSATIAGGTSEIQRNIIASLALGS